MVKNQKARAFYDTFERRGPGEKDTTYCPGCGHGTAHKLIAEAIDEFGIQDRVVFCSPVGCSVFAYYYFDTGNVQCAHGRAPAVATGISRSLTDAIVVSYQGDGDLAGIGLGAIMHAANRGESMCVFFVNNAIYGMTGGQMAPTTLAGQVTLTTPEGRLPSRDGHPIAMCEIIDTLTAPVYIERVSLGDPKRILKARAAVRAALRNQVEKRGFSFVEILSPCPINWKMSALDARTWLMENLESVFPLKQFRKLEDAPPKSPPPEPMGDQELLDFFTLGKNFDVDRRQDAIDDHYVKIAGFGGQGIMSAGVLLANCALAEGRAATWLPSYGPEMRGGTANASVIVSSAQIGSPVVNTPNALIAMNGPSLSGFETSVVSGGLVLVNSSLIASRVKRSDVRALYVPANELALQAGLAATASLIILCVYALASGCVELETIRKLIPFALKKKQLAEVNLRALDIAAEHYAKNLRGDV